MIFLDHCVPFRLQIGQLVVEEVECRIAEQEILIVVASLVFIIVQIGKTFLFHSYVMLPLYSSQ